MKKILIITLTILMVFSLCSVSVLAVTEGEVQSQVAAQGKEKVTGNIFIWFLCAIAFLKVSQKIDSFMSSLGINVGHTGGSMLGELMIAFKGVQAISGGSIGSSHGGGGGSSSGSGSDAAFLSGGLAGAVGRTTERHAASSVTNQQSHTISQKLYNSSVQKGGDFANTVIGAVAKGSIKEQGSITGDRAAEAMTSYFGYAGQTNAPQFSDMEIGGGRIIGKESIGGGAPTEFAMYNADQYMKPEGAFTLETAKDGSKWYMKNAITNIATRVSLKAQSLGESAKNCLNNEDGDFYISEGVKVIIAVILGSLLIIAMVALFNSQIIPGIQDKITELFGAYSGPTVVDPTVGGYTT